MSKLNDISDLNVSSCFLFLKVCIVTTQSAPVTKETSGCNSECPAGYAASTLCNATVEASPCEPCESGVTFNDAAGVGTVCRPCRVCPANSRVVSLCDAVSDTQCQCLPDFYQEVRLVKRSSVGAGNASDASDKVDDTTQQVTHSNQLYNNLLFWNESITVWKTKPIVIILWIVVADLFLIKLAAGI